MGLPTNTRVAALDGWRGIAILLVLIDHAQGFFLGHILFGFTATGHHGVTVFFVLSGFLITSKLLEDDLSLKNFYIRRVFRILPMVTVYLLAVELLSLMSKQILVTPAELASCVFFYRNYFHQHESGLLAHFWSLSVEEQFYLLWPPVLLLAGRRAAFRCALAGAVICALLRVVFWSYYDRLWFSLQTEVRADALFAGCLLAMLFEKPAFREWMSQYRRPITLAALAVFLFCFRRDTMLPPLSESVAIAALIGVSVLRQPSWMARILSFRPLTSLGVISYSVYIWQQYVFCLEGNLLRLAAILCLPAFALLLHDLVEQPMISMGRRLTTEKPPVLAEA